MNSHWQAHVPVTPSNCEALACRKRFRTLYVDRLWPQNGHDRKALRGMGVHSVLKNVYDRTNGPMPNLAHLDTYAEMALPRYRYANQEERDEDIQQILHAVRRYVGTDPDIEHTIGVERTLRAPINLNGQYLCHLQARIDRLIVRPEEPTTLVLVDYKSGAASIRLEPACIMLFIAKKCFMAFEHVVLEAHGVSDDPQPPCRIYPHDLKGVFPILRERIARVYTAGEFPPEPGEVCEYYCPLRDTCQPDGPAFDLGELDAVIDNIS